MPLFDMKFEILGTNLTKTLQPSSTRDQEKSEVTVSALRWGHGQDSSLKTGSWCRISKIQFEFYLACTPQDLPNSSSPEVEPQSGTQPCKVANTHNGVIACITVRGRKNIYGGRKGEEMRKEKNPTVKQTPVSESFIRYSSSAFHRLNLYENLCASSPCSRLVPFTLWLKPEWDVRM